MAKKMEVSAAMLADFVARGHANKITIVNAFSGNVILNEIPSEISFGIYLELRFKDGKSPQALTFEILFNGTQHFHGAAAGAPQLNPDEPATIVIPYFTVLVPNEGQLEMYVEAEGYARTRVLSKRIFKGPVSSA